MNEQIADEIYSKGFHIIENFLDQTTYQKLKETAEMMDSNGQFKAAKVGNGLNSTLHATIRNDKIMWLEEETGDLATKIYFNKIRELSKALNQNLFLGLVDFESHFAIFQPNSFYKKHVDQFITSKERRISCVYYLNSNWQESFGGQLKLYNREDQLLATVLPKANRFICFSSDLPHEVCATKETRYSIAGWMKTRALALNHLKP